VTLKIAIVGGGIGGLAAAAFLNQAGLSATVYEQTSELREIGAGLVVAPNMARLLRRLGVLDPLLKTAVRLETGWEFRRWQDGADLLDAINRAVPDDAVRLGKRCLRVEPADGPEGAGPVLLTFADGEVVEADLVIGADGIHSLIRAALTETQTPPAYSGSCAFRALVPAEDAPAFARDPAQVLWLGPGRHLVHYPVRAGELINLVAFAPAGGYTTESWTATATVAEFLAEFEGWDPRLTALIEAAGVPGRWALLDRQPLRRWSRGPVTLLGDAAHPMFPFYGQGAAQAIEDAAALARCLSEELARERADPAAALRRYEAARIPRTSRLQQVSHARGRLNHLPDGADQRDRDLAFAATDALEANAWIYAYDPAE